MGKTGDIYVAVDELRDAANAAFQGLETEDDLVALGEQLGSIRDKADRLQTVVFEVDAALKTLAS